MSRAGFGGGDDFAPKKKAADGELDITPMIDVTFLLLIFFMVSSTMQASKKEQLEPAKNVNKSNPESMIEVSVLAPTSSGATPVMLVDNKEITLEDLAAHIVENAEVANRTMVVSADRDVPNGFLAKVYKAASEVEGMTFHLAVEEKKR